MKPLIIFGTSQLAEIAHYYFSKDTEYQVCAFTVDQEYISQDIFLDIPVIPFHEIDQHYSTGEAELFIAISYQKLNSIRREKYLEAKKIGYKLASYISTKATILNDYNFGDNCFILEDNTIQPFVKIGNNVTLWSGNHIGHHSCIRDHCFISSHVVISGGVTIDESCFVGVNATVRDHVEIGEKCVIGAGALIIKDTEAEGVYLGHASERSRVPSTRLRSI